MYIVSLTRTKTYSIGLAQVQNVLCYYGDAKAYRYTNVYISTREEHRGKDSGCINEQDATKKSGEIENKKGKEKREIE